VATIPDLDLKVNVDWDPVKKALESLVETSERLRIWADVNTEIVRAREKHGDQHHLPMGTGPRGSILSDLQRAADRSFSDLAGLEDNDNWQFEIAAKALCETGEPDWARIVLEEFAEVMASDEEHLDAELVQLIAMGVSMLQAHRRQRAAS
jgi:hypothetical protein